MLWLVQGFFHRFCGTGVPPISAKISSPAASEPAQRAASCSPRCQPWEKRTGHNLSPGRGDIRPPRGLRIDRQCPDAAPPGLGNVLPGLGPTASPWATGRRPLRGLRAGEPSRRHQNAAYLSAYGRPARAPSRPVPTRSLPKGWPCHERWHGQPARVHWRLV